MTAQLIRVNRKLAGKYYWTQNQNESLLPADGSQSLEENLQNMLTGLKDRMEDEDRKEHDVTDGCMQRYLNDRRCLNNGIAKIRKQLAVMIPEAEEEIAKLENPVTRQFIRLYFLEGCSYRKIAYTMFIAERTVTNYRAQALEEIFLLRKRSGTI